MGDAREDLARFQHAEIRLVYARHRDRPHDPLFYLVDGAAAELRAWTRGHLECFMPSCVDRRLTTVSRSRARDGFAHFPGAGRHSAESLFHQQGKALIARWARVACPSATVVLEQATDDHTRRADVMITWPDGAQVAVEVQYSPLTVAEWQNRHTSYLAAGITPVWLFGHTGAHLRTTPGEPVQVTLNAVQQALLATGSQPLWINPLTEQIATTWTSSTVVSGDPDDPPSRPIPAHPDAQGLGIAVDGIDGCTLTPTGLSTPALAMLSRNADELRDARAAITARRAAELTAWTATGLRQQVINRYGEVPRPLNVPLPTDLAIHAAPEHWRCLLYGDLVLAHPPHTTVSVEACRDLLYRRGVADTASPTASTAAIVGFLEQLATAGCLQLNRRSGRIITVTVIADLETVLAGRQEHLRMQQEREASRQRVDEYRYRRLQLEVEDKANRRHHGTPTPTGRSLRCDVCGNRLAPDQQRLGRHAFCSPTQRSPL